MRTVRILAEELCVGAVIDDDQFRYVMKVGHIVVGPKWVTVRAFHPKAHVYPNPPYRMPRGSFVEVAASS